MPEQLAFTALLNRLFAGPVDALLRAIGLPPRYPQAPISNPVAMEILVVAGLILLFLFVRARLSLDRPGGLQHVFEGLHGFIEGQSREIIGHHSEAFTAFLVAQALFILLCNLLGLVPGFESPTATPTVPLGCAIAAFVYYNLQGVRRHGPLGYARNFIPLGADVPLAVRVVLGPVMLVIEMISHVARVLSLTVRLFANMFAGDLVTLVFFSLVPLAIPILFLGLHIFVSFLQTYIFVLLTTVYLAGAVAAEH
jgi:F-type H+-transporting ATPase subunit a